MTSLSLEQRPYSLYSFHQFIKFTQFLGRQNLPTLRGRSVVAKAEKQFADFVEGESELAGATNHGETVNHGHVEASLSADSLSLGEDTDLFVIANGGRLQPNLSRYLGNR